MAASAAFAGPDGENNIAPMVRASVSLYRIAPQEHERSQTSASSIYSEFDCNDNRIRNSRLT